MSAKRRRSSDSVNCENLSQGSNCGGYRMRTTCFSDPAMGERSIELNEACVKVIHTEEFGRLHHIKQTGGCFLVFPSATHTRFEHSLGTCWLAGHVVKRLKEQQPELEINDRDILAVELAALCHDLGHGPFSHTFDQMFIPQAVPGVQWKHENASKAMFRRLLEKNPKVKQYLDNILMEEDYIFIEEAIAPLDDEAHNAWPFNGRPFGKAFLYDIVSNKSHGFDVDKWDYTRRDAVHMSVHTNANLIRLLQNLRVLPVGDSNRMTICYRDKVRSELCNLATTRAQLHQVAYQHRAVKAAEIMIVDVLLMADQCLRFSGKNGEQIRMSDMIGDMDAYVRMTDDIVFGEIYRTTGEDLEEARELVKRISQRRLYDKVGQVLLKDSHVTAFEGTMRPDISTEIASKFWVFKEQYPNIDEEVLEKNLAVVISDIHGGKEDGNPVESVWFFGKEHLQNSDLKPFRYKESDLVGLGPPPRQKFIRVFCRKENDPELMQCSRQCLRMWCEDKGLPVDCKIDSNTPSIGKSDSFDQERDTVRKDLMEHPAFQFK